MNKTEECVIAKTTPLFDVDSRSIRRSSNVINVDNPTSIWFEFSNFFQRWNDVNYPTLLRCRGSDAVSTKSVVRTLFGRCFGNVVSSTSIRFALSTLFQRRFDVACDVVSTLKRRNYIQYIHVVNTRGCDIPYRRFYVLQVYVLTIQIFYLER